MDILRTPDDRFDDLPGYPFAPRYTDITDGLRVHHVEEGPEDGPVVLMLHGEPSWSFLYRKMIPIFASAGFRAIAPDLIGFGRSDKPTSQQDYTYQRHVDWLWAWVEALGLRDIHLVCQDWGGLIGLRHVAEHPDRFASVTAANTGLPNGNFPVSKAFLKWREFSSTADAFDVGRVIQNGTVTELSDAVIAAYDAPFPDDRYKAGARIFPSLVPISKDDPAVPAQMAAWKVLMKLDKPFLTAFSDSDPITRHGDKLLRQLIPGTKGQPHTTIEGGGHFLQEDCGEALAKVVIDFIGGLSA